MPGFSYAAAALGSLDSHTKSARRLGGAVQWLTLAWLNTEGLTDDLRVPALRAGFEILLNHESSLELARRLSRLLEDDTPPKTREWTLAKEHRSASLSDISWWFIRLSFLGNKLMHGTRPTEDDWVHDGVRHVDLAEAYLRRAIKATIAKDNPALRRDIKIQRQVKSLRAEKARLLREARTPNARGSGQTSQGRARGLGREP